MWIGITNNHEQVQKIRGWSIVDHRNTWAYCDSRLGFQLGGNRVDSPLIEKYRVGDTIGIYLDADNKKVSFWKNRMLQGDGDYPLYEEKVKSWHFFVLEDFEDDEVEIVHFCWGKLINFSKNFPNNEVNNNYFGGNLNNFSTLSIKNN